VSREEIITAVKECTAKLGRAPGADEFRVTMQVRRHLIRKHFSTYTQLLAECGMERHGSGAPLTLERLFEDWAGMARNLGKIPTATDYDRHGNYSCRAYMNRFKYWKQVPACMLAFMVEKGLGREWQDVQKLIAEHLKMSLAEATKYKLPSGCTSWPRTMADRPIYGLPLRDGSLPFSPTNEAGVLAAFACHARELGFTILRLQAAFPDCEALREVGPNRGQRVLIELEYESRNFLEHMHPINGCDLIVCWINNWPDCPLEVIELSSVLRDLQNRQNLTADKR
jgi:HNH endonuclease